MTQADLHSLLDFAEASGLMGTPFQEAYALWQKALQEAYDDFLADLCLSSPELEELPYLDMAI